MNLPKKFVGWLTINRECNLRCQWCYAKVMGFSKKDNMNGKIFEMAINLYKNLPLNDVILIGGEPTIHPNIIEIIKLIKNSQLRPLLLTNSIKLANKKFFEQLVEAGLIGVCTSLKAGTENHYHELTGRKALNAVKKAMKNLKEFDIDHKVSTTICKPLLDEFDPIIEIVVQNDIKWFTIEFERPLVYRNRVDIEDMAPPEQLVDFCLESYPKLIKAKINFVFRISIPFCLFPENFIETLIQKKHITSGCQIYNGTGVVIDPKGRILPCGHFCDNPIGQLGDDFITAEEYLNFRQRDKVKKIYDAFYFCPNKKCVDCKYWPYCGAGCRVRWLKGAKTDKLIGDFRQKEV